MKKCIAVVKETKYNVESLGVRQICARLNWHVFSSANIVSGVDLAGRGLGKGAIAPLNKNTGARVSF